MSSISATGAASNTPSSTAISHQSEVREKQVAGHDAQHDGDSDDRAGVNAQSSSTVNALGQTVGSILNVKA